MKRSLLAPNRSAPAAIILIGIIAAVFSLGSCSRGDYSGRMESITIGTMFNAQDALLLIADEQGFFSANGLKVTIKKYDTGCAATDAMINGEVDLARANEFVVVEKTLQQGQISVLTTYCKTESISLVGRKDRGIEKIPDLKGKRIGLASGTVTEFYLGRFLDLHGMSLRDITIVDMKRTRMVDAFSAGDIDACIDGQLFVYPIRQRQGDRVVVWPAQSSQLQYVLLVGMHDWIAHHSELIKRLLSSLARAEAYVVRHTAETKAILQKRLRYDDAFMADSWPKHQFSLSLDQSLILAMEDEARWMIGNNLTSEKQVPDFLSYIYIRGLEAVKPEAMNIIRGRDLP